MFNWFKKVFSFLTSFATRPGLQKYLQKYESIALQIVTDFAKVNSGKDFHDWKDAAWEAIKAATDTDKGNWVAIIRDLAFEAWKYKQEQAEQKALDERGN